MTIWKVKWELFCLPRLFAEIEERYQVTVFFKVISKFGVSRLCKELFGQHSRFSKFMMLSRRDSKNKLGVIERDSMAKTFFSKHFGLNEPKNQFWNLIMLDFQYFENFSSILIEKFFWHVIQTYWPTSTSTNIVIACRNCQKTNIGKEWKKKNRKKV